MNESQQYEFVLIKQNQEHLNLTLSKLESAIEKQTEAQNKQLMQQVEFNQKLQGILEQGSMRHKAWDESLERVHKRIDSLESKVEKLQSRESELDKLNDFIEAFNAMKWKVVTGVGGILILSIWQAIRTTPAMTGN